ncbi:HNH endonuclease [Glaciimonas sp. PAMC28666]|uniref:HNH endonuclease n=1 Tax=Glaciimonas sp. PAMC28666 TaxID=2807626 RepID=UPI001F0416C7|nr:HNH endonuclease [Glaciimonas sp. PAMC28666]
MCKALTAYPSGFELDHVTALANGGTNDDSNQQILCHACHELKTLTDLGQKQRMTIGDDGWPSASPMLSTVPRWRRAEAGFRRRK